MQIKLLPAVFFLLPMVVEAQATLSDTVKRDTIHSISEVIINAERKINVNYLNIRGNESPMTINVLDNKLLQEMNITRMEDVVQNIPGIHSVHQYGAFQFFNIRGFDDFVVLNDGIRDERHTITQSAPMTNLANVERVESLKGPSGEIFGHSALGGIINIVRKKPTEYFTGNASVTYGSYDTYQTVFGLGGPISKTLRYRADVGINKTDGWRGVKEATHNFSGVLQYLVSPRTNLELYLQYNKDHYAADKGVATDNFGNILPGFDYKQNYSIPSDYTKNERVEAKLKFTHRFHNNSKLNNVLSYYHDDIDYLVDNVIFYNPQNQTVSHLNAAYHFNHITKPIVNQLDYQFHFNTGFIKHQALAGNTVSYVNRKTLYRNVESGDSKIEIPLANYFQWGENHTTDLSRIYSFNELMIGTYFHDWIQFSERFKALLSMRYDYFSGKYRPRRKVEEPETITRDEIHNFTYRFGLSYQPVKDFMSVYASASNFFKPTRLHNHRVDKPFVPQRGFQIESGVKLNKKNLFNLSVSGFYIEKNNVIVGHNIQSQVGGATSKGFEVDTDWSIHKQLYLRLGYAYTDAKFISKGQSQEHKAIVGNRTPWTPLHTFNSWINYEFTHRLNGLGIGAGAYFADKTYQNEFNTQSLPGYMIANATVYYKTKNNIRLGLNIENIFDKLYYRSALSSNDLYSDNPADKVYQSPMQVYPGRGRNFRVSIGYEF